MPTEPIIALPSFAGMSLPGMLWTVLAIVTIIFVIHFLVAAYHWLTFGSERTTSIVSIAIYGGVGLFILLLMTLTLFTL